MRDKKRVQIPTALYGRMREDLKNYRVFFFSAPCGCGKTTVAEYYLSGLRTYSLADGDTDFPKLLCSGGYDALLADDLQTFRSSETLRLLERFVDRSPEGVGPQSGSPDGGGSQDSAADSCPPLTVMLLSRGRMPGWLLPHQLAGEVQTVETKDLMFDIPATVGLLASYGVRIDHAAAASIQRELKGYPLAVALLGGMLSHGGTWGPQALETCRGYVCSYLGEAVLRGFSGEDRHLLLSLALFDWFDDELAACLDSGRNTGAFIRGIRDNSSMLVSDAGGRYRFWPIFRTFLLTRQTSEMSDAERKEILLKAAVFSEHRGEFGRALEFYSRSDHHADVSRLLLENARLHPGVGHYRELRDYYFSLPDEEVLRSPELMRALSVLCAMCLDYEGSERWYNALKACAAALKRSGGDYRGAEAMTAYLDIALPQRSTDGVVPAITAAFRAMSDDHVFLPPFSVTSSLPSIMNGGKDFCEWSKRDDLLYATMKGPVEAVLGKDGVGLADCAICESKFERGEDVSRRMFALMGRLGEIQSRGTPDIEFAVIGLLARVQVSQGKIRAAYDLIRGLRDKYASRGEERFIPNMDAMLCRMSLCLADNEAAEEWLREKSPSVGGRLWTMWRYQYITRAMVQALDVGGYDDALLLMARLRPYTEKCGRVMDGIHLHMLSAILMERAGVGNWEDELTAAVDTCSRYGFIRPIAFYGAAALALLRRSGYGGAKSGRGGFPARLMSAVREQAVYYPRFLRPAARLTEPLSAAELQVLRLICANLSNREIGEILNISLSTVKTHTAHIFQKLGVKRRGEAEEAAVRLNIIGK